MAWQGMVATGHKAAQAEAQQATFDQQQAAARAKNQPQVVEHPIAPPATKDGHFDGGNVAHFDGGSDFNCTCKKSRPGRLGLLRRHSRRVYKVL